jgi:hypothetical protein
MGRYTDVLVDPFRGGGNHDGACGAAAAATN